MCFVGSLAHPYPHLAASRTCLKRNFGSALGRPHPHLVSSKNGLLLWLRHPYPHFVSSEAKRNKAKRSKAKQQNESKSALSFPCVSKSALPFPCANSGISADCQAPTACPRATIATFERNRAHSICGMPRSDNNIVWGQQSKFYL